MNATGEVISLSGYAARRRPSTIPPAAPAIAPVPTATDIYANLAADRRYASAINGVLAVRLQSDGRLLLVLSLVSGKSVPDEWLLRIKLGIIDKNSGYRARARPVQVLERRENQVALLTLPLEERGPTNAVRTAMACLVWKTPGGMRHERVGLMRLLNRRFVRPAPH